MSHRWRTALGVLALAAVWLVGQHVGGLDTGMLFLGPAFVLVLPLLVGRYPGERLLTAFLPEKRRRAPCGLVSRRWLPTPCRARGGLLIACALGKRGPPAGAPAA